MGSLGIGELLMLALLVATAVGISELLPESWR